MVPATVLAVAAYLLGSIPFGYMIGRARRVDLTAVGSGNIGSTNIYRALGLRAALVAFLLDAGKGLVGTRVVPLVWPTGLEEGTLRFVCGIAVILGSVASVFMRFRGGKGVATGAGVFLGLAPLAAGICLAAWGVLVAITRYVSLGSLVAAAMLPVLLLALDGPGVERRPVFYLSVAVAVIVFVRHRSNLKRLLAGREHRVGRVKTNPAAGARAGGTADTGEGEP